MSEGVFEIHGLGGKSSTVKRLKGWNLRPDGELVKLDQDYTVKVTKGPLTSGTVTLGSLDRVALGGYVAFESEESINNPLGPVDQATIMEVNPVRRWEMELAKSVGWFTRTSSEAVGVHVAPRHFEPWLSQVQPGSTSISLANVPALPGPEGARPGLINILPRVSVHFSDPSLSDKPDFESWDAMARWFHGRFDAMTPALQVVDLEGKKGVRALNAIHGWMQHDFTYKQVYLTPERSWLPESAKEVLRQRFGDCKDLTGLFLAAAKGAGMEASPVLAMIHEGKVEMDEDVTPFVFNHVIAAVRLPVTAGLPSEVTTPFGRFLLVDSTGRYTPLGYLPSAHRGGRLLICTPGGAAWVDVPANATKKPQVKTRVEASETAAGGLKGTLVVSAFEGALGLRDLALEGGMRAVKERLASILDLPFDSVWDVDSIGDPLAGEEAFAVQIGFALPKALVPFGRAWLLPRLGLPGDLTPLRSPGRIRRYPVSIPADLPWEYTAALRLISPVKPSMPTGRLETPLRTATWKADAATGTWKLEYRQSTQGLDLPYDDRERGVRTQRDDWKKYQNYMDDILTVVREPGPSPDPGPGTRIHSR